jgi:hypothetical protein
LITAQPHTRSRPGHLFHLIPLFDQRDHPFVLTCQSAERRAQALSMLPKAPGGLGIESGEHGAMLCF